MRWIVILILLSLFTTRTRGQSSQHEQTQYSTLVGTVKAKSSQRPMLGASILLLDASKKVIVGTTTDIEGEFSLQLDHPVGNYFLKIYFLGHQTVELDLSQYSTKDSILVLLEETELEIQEVEVKEERILIYSEKNKTHLVIPQEDSNTSLFDFLIQAPFIGLTQSDELIIDGKPVYHLLLNGKPSNLVIDNLTDILKSIPGKIIKSIEIWHTPPIQFQRLGDGPMINLILSNDYLDGLSIGANHFQSYIPQNEDQKNSFKETAFLNRKIKDSTFSLTGGWNTQNEPISRSKQSRVDSLTQSTLSKEGLTSTKSKDLNIASKYHLNLDSLKEISIGFNFGKNGMNQQSQSNFEEWNAGIQNLSSTENRASNSNLSSKSSLSFYQKLGKTKSNLIELDLTYYLNHSNNSSRINSKTQNEEFFSNKRKFQDGNLLLNYSKSFKETNLDLGLDLSQQNEKSSWQFLNIDPTTGEYDDEKFSERISFSTTQTLRPYVNTNLEIWGISTTMGISLEKTLLQAHFSDTDFEVSKNYLNVFPNLSFFIVPFTGLNMNLSYQKNWQIPDLYFLNPFVEKSDDYHVSTGNPNLSPSINHNTTLAIHKQINKSYPSLRISYLINKNLITSFSTIENGVTYTTFQNIGSNNVVSLGFNNNFRISKNISTNLNFNASGNTYTTLIQNEEIIRKQWNYSAFSMVRYQVNKAIRIHYSMNFTSRNLNFLTYVQSMFRSTFSVNWDIGKRKNSNLIFTVINPQGEKREVRSEELNPNFYSFHENSTVIRRFTISYNYRINKFK